MSRRSRRAATPRAWLALALLIPFAIGSQRCMVGALGYGGAMRCLAIPTAEAAPAGAGCCHGPARAPADGEAAPDVPIKSCCIASAPVPSAHALDTAEASGPTPAVATTPHAPRVPDGGTPVRLAATESPPDPLEGPPLRSRAPPRA